MLGQGLCRRAKPGECVPGAQARKGVGAYRRDGSMKPPVETARARARSQTCGCASPTLSEHPLRVPTGVPAWHPRLLQCAPFGPQTLPPQVRVNPLFAGALWAAACLHVVGPLPKRGRPVWCTLLCPVCASAECAQVPWTMHGMCTCSHSSPLHLRVAVLQCAGLQANCSAVSILDFAGTSPTASGGLITTYADGRETMAFLFDCAVWSPSCLLLAHTSLAWLLRDIIPGSRRALLSVQADDVFLTTGGRTCVQQPPAVFVICGTSGSRPAQSVRPALRMGAIHRSGNMHSRPARQRCVPSWAPTQPPTHSPAHPTTRPPRGTPPRRVQRQGAHQQAAFLPADARSSEPAPPVAEHHQDPAAGRQRPAPGHAVQR